MSTQTQPQTDQDLERRAKMVAAIRALADFVETRTDLPMPNSVHAQHSLMVVAAINEHKVRAVAEKLGVEPDIDEGSATVTHNLSVHPIRVDYTVYGRLPKPAAERVAPSGMKTGTCRHCGEPIWLGLLWVHTADESAERDGHRAEPTPDDAQSERVA